MGPGVESVGLPLGLGDGEGFLAGELVGDGGVAVAGGVEVVLAGERLPVERGGMGQAGLMLGECFLMLSDEVRQRSVDEVLGFGDQAFLGVAEVGVWDSHRRWVAG